METTVAARSAGCPHREITFRYDYLGRRVQKRVVDVTQSLEVSSRRFLYDGWSLVAEYAAPGGTSCGALLRSYTWGLDIVTSLAQSGGVGALLQIADHPSGKTYLPAYDGNGNIAALLNASTGALAAAYEYSPFGEPLRAQTLDSTVADNPFRFSTKYTDVETGLVYYGHRYYDPKNGRFINRDPIEESGGINLYGFCGNNPGNRWDRLGMCDGPNEACTEPENELGIGTPAAGTTSTGASDTATTTPVPQPSNPTPEVVSDYMGSYNPDDVPDPNAMTLYVNGIAVGAVSSAAATEISNQIGAFNATVAGNADQSGNTPVNATAGNGTAATAANDGNLAFNASFGSTNTSLLAGPGSNTLAGPAVVGSSAAGADLTFSFTISASPSAFLGGSGTGSSSLSDLAPNSGGASVFLSPGVVPPAPVNNPASGTSITVNGYGTLTVTNNSSDLNTTPVDGAPNGVVGTRMSMAFTPNNGQPATNYVWVQWITNDPYAQQVNPSLTSPRLDASTPSGTYNDNFPSGRYNNGTPVYSGGSLNFYDHPQNPAGSPVNFSTFLIDKNTGTILQQINWNLPPHP